jgi:hypothetical protein
MRVVVVPKGGANVASPLAQTGRFVIGTHAPDNASREQRLAAVKRASNRAVVRSKRTRPVSRYAPPDTIDTRHTLSEAKI